MGTKKRGGPQAHPNMAKAVAAYQAGDGSCATVAKRFGLSTRALDSGIRRASRTPEQKAELALRAKAYEKTKNGLLMRAYRNMLSRVSGVQRKKAHLYAGKTILPRAEFYAWTRGAPAFHALFQAWEASGHERRLTPSVNRINPALGYAPGNIEWITHGLNSSIAARQPRKIKDKQRIAIYNALNLELK